MRPIPILRARSRSKVFGFFRRRPKTETYPFGKKVLHSDDLLEEAMQFLNAYTERKRLSTLPGWFAHVEILWMFKCDLLNGGLNQAFINRTKEQLRLLDDIASLSGASKLKSQFRKSIDEAKKGKNSFLLIDGYSEEDFEENFYDMAHNYISKKMQDEQWEAFPIP